MSSPKIGEVQKLHRVLSLRDLIFYGIVAVTPSAPATVFGLAQQKSHGHVVVTILAAMVAMVLTAISYGRMAQAYPSAGSAFTYVGQEISPALGYVTGLSMVLEYLLNPLICIIWCSQQANVFAPGIPYWIWAIFFGVIFTWLNVQGVKTSARVNAGLAAAMGIVVVIFFVAVAHYVFGHPHQGMSFFTRPFYDPQTWNGKSLMGATSLAVLGFIGFDGISTLSEEAENPRRNILLATVLTCFVIGVLSAMEVYAAQLVWPITEPYPNVDTAFTFVAQRAWRPLFGIVGLTLVVANFGSGIAAQLGAARLLYGMGRSSALPKAFFGAIDSKHHVPRNSVLAVGALALAGAFILPAVAGEATGYELGANLLNFGALIAFMGVNASAFARYFLHEEKKKISNFAPPLLGFCICALLWWNVSTKARIIGGIFMMIGIAYGAWKTRGFRGNLIDFELPPEDAA